MRESREDARRARQGAYYLTWKRTDGQWFSAEGRGLDISSSGVGIESPREIDPDTIVHVQAVDGTLTKECFVVHCSRRGARYHIGLEFTDQVAGEAEPAEKPTASYKQDGEVDYYDILQISPKAEVETIHRVFRIMAVRFHPDNPETGDVEEFLRLKQAYAVLSDPERRAQYDAIRGAQETGPMPIFELKDFVTGVEAESNRRLGVLSLLYNQRRTDPDKPGVSLLDLEKRMGFPREYLNFTMWYLRSKDFVTVADNSDYALTAPGVDYVEGNAGNSEILTRLIKPGPQRVHQARPATPPKPEPSHPTRRLMIESGMRDLTRRADG